jgi:DNA-binding winged helix-turn-helix (wHTH) protein
MRYTFDAYLLDTACYELYHGGTRVPLRPKALEVLAYLVVHHDRVVSKQELLAQLWPDQVIGGDGLKAYIMAVRHALGERGAAPRLLRTMRGRGYRLVAPVTVGDPAGAPPLPPHLAVTPEVMEAPGRLAPPLAVTDSAPPEMICPVVDEEYKRVSVLCCALPDTVSLAARLGPEALYRLLQTVSRLVQEVLRHCEGTLTQQASEGWMAVFGVPAAQEDHARRAVLAALALHERLRQHPALRAQVAGADLAMQMGVHSGLVVVGELGQDAPRVPTVLGTPGPARPATPGAGRTRDAAPERCHVPPGADGGASHPGGTLAVDGCPTPMPVYSVQGFVGRHTGVAGRGSRARSPFVGRARELAPLHDRLAAVRAGEGQVVSLVGPMGMGKTRLLTEFGRHLAPDQVTWYGGHCLAYGQAIPYLPVRDLVGQLCALVEGESAAARMAAVQRRLHTRGI